MQFFFREIHFIKINKCLFEFSTGDAVILTTSMQQYVHILEYHSFNHTWNVFWFLKIWIQTKVDPST